MATDSKPVMVNPTRLSRLAGALFSCPSGRDLLEDIRLSGRDLRQIPLNPDSLFLIDDVRDLCRQLHPSASENTYRNHADIIGQELVQSSNRHIWSELVTGPAVAWQSQFHCGSLPLKSRKKEFTP